MSVTIESLLTACFMRLFLALDIDDPIRDRITRFVDGVRNFSPNARWVKAESLHVTLKFIGEQPDDAVEKIKQALKDVSAATTEIKFRGYGFFPTPKSARVFWIGMESGPQLAQLAAAIDEKMANFGVKKERLGPSPLRQRGEPDPPAARARVKCGLKARSSFLIPRFAILSSMAAASCASCGPDSIPIQKTRADFGVGKKP